MAKSAIKDPSNRPSSALYEDDYSAWIDEQVVLLRTGRLQEIDSSNIAEELDGLSKSEFRALVSDLAVLIQHLLKWDFQAERRNRSWLLSIREHRRRVVKHLKENPSFRSRIDEAIDDAHATARNRALAETGLGDETIPETCPFNFDHLMTREIALTDASGN